MYGIYKIVMSTPRGDSENYLSIAEGGVSIISGMGVGQATDVVMSDGKVSFKASVGPGVWSFELKVSDGAVEGTAKHGELDDTAPIKGQKADIDYDAAVAAASSLQGPTGGHDGPGGGGPGGPGGPGGLGGPGGPEGMPPMGGPGGPPPMK